MKFQDHILKLSFVSLGFCRCRVEIFFFLKVFLGYSHHLFYVHLNTSVVFAVAEILILQDSAAVTGLAIAGASLVAVNTTGNAIYDPIGSIIVGNLLGMVIWGQKTAYCCNDLMLESDRTAI